MVNSTKRKALRRAKKKARRFVLGRPPAAGVITFVGGLIIKRAIDYYLSDALSWVEGLVRRILDEYLN